MELNDLKIVWQKEKVDLENRIKLNEKWIKELSFDKSKGAFDKFVSTAILGRNLALCYGLVSVWVAISWFKAQHEYAYGATALIGGLAMMVSFLQHLSIKRLDFSKMNTIELQKEICQFRVHILKHFKSDVTIVCIWILTFLASCLPALFQAWGLLFNLLLLLLPAILLYFIWALFNSKKIYNKWDTELKELEVQLGQIVEFEKN